MKSAPMHEGFDTSLLIAFLRILNVTTVTHLFIPLSFCGFCPLPHDLTEHLSKVS